MPPRIGQSRAAIRGQIETTTTIPHRQSRVCNFLDASCGGVYEDGSGTISSPGYPNGYAHNLDCVWLVQRTVDIPDFIFTDFSTENTYDMVKISAGRYAVTLFSCPFISLSRLMIINLNSYLTLAM